MSNWKLINKIFTYDGTFNGLLTIVFYCYSNKLLPQNVYAEEKYIPNFLDKVFYIKTDENKAERVFN